MLKTQEICGLQRGLFGYAPALVVGAGKSSRATLSGAFTIAVNPLHGRFDFALGMDQLYWSTFWTRGHAAFPLIPSGIDGPADCPAIQFHADGMPRLSIFRAVLAAKYLTHGAVVLTGCDYIYADEAEQNAERTRPVAAWSEFIAECGDELYRHPDMQGPLVEMLPVFGKHDSMEWDVIGSGPSALSWRRSGNITITTNAGIDLLATPDYYFVGDTLAVEKFKPQYTRAQALGTQIITQCPASTFSIPVTTGPYTAHDVGRASGNAILMFALKHGAKTVNLYGFDGHATERLDFYQNCAEWFEKIARMFPDATINWISGRVSHLPVKNLPPNVNVLPAPFVMTVSPHVDDCDIVKRRGAGRWFSDAALEAMTPAEREYALADRPEVSNAV